MDSCDYKPNPQNSYERFMNEKYWANNRPMTIHFELTQRCNLRCVHCLFTHESQEELSAAEVCNTLMQLKDMGVFNLSLSGGEIFARRDIGEILDFLSLHRFIVTLYTNGTLLNETLLDKIARMNPFGVEISFYGASAAVHDSITRVPGSLVKSIEALRELKRLNVAVLFKGFLLKNNFHERWMLVELAHRLGALYSFDFNLMPMENGDIRNLSAGLTMEQIEELYGEVANKGLILRNNVTIQSRDSQLPKGGNVICNPGRINGCIAANGDVFPCPTLRIPMGNLRQKSFQEIWNTNKIDAARYMKLSDLKECPECPTLEYCNRCPGVAYLETGDYLGPSPAAVCSKYKSLSRTKERW